MRRVMLVLLTAMGIAGCTRIEGGRAIPASDSTASPPSVAAAPERAAPAPDNTAVNKRDADLATKQPTDQAENQADRDRTAQIRQRILDTKDLSIDARNVKVITADGKVTLRGPVNSADERQTIAKIAADIAGEGNVDNKLEVITDRTAERPSERK